ncbi:MAG: response regulator transcription factor [Oscillospiraceae bacterium]|nr:response regulator transcription factor [Oscillospiraceae bacterium]
MSKKIFIVEDDENIREMVKVALISFSFEVAAFDNAENALTAISETTPDMIILDIMLPGMNGLEMAKILRSKPETKDIPIIILTAKDTELDTVTGLDCGADDYIAKPFGVMELGARIRSVFRRTDKADTLSKEDTIISDLVINHNTREVKQNQKLIDLTFKEFEILCLLVAERGNVISRDKFLQEIWGFDFVGESRTLDIHIRTLRQKLGDDMKNPKYIKTIRNVGYRFVGDS